MQPVAYAPEPHREQILIATVTMVVETLPALRGLAAWSIIEAVCVLFFTIEILLKLTVLPVRKLHLFFLNIMNMLDLIAIIPFYSVLAQSMAVPPERPGLQAAARGLV